MKRSLMVGALIVGISTLALFLLSRHRATQAAYAPPPSPDATTTANAATNQPPASLAQSPPPKNNSPTPVTQATAIAGAIPANTAFADFAKWAEQFSQSSASVVDGRRLAWKRREAMLELIQTDPAQALALAAPFAWRQQLPPQVTKYFEAQLDGRGDFLVAAATDFDRGRTMTYRHVQIGGTNYQAFVYGRRRAQISRTGIPLHGISLDGKMAVSTEPLRRLSQAEAAARDKSVAKPDVICSVSGQAVTARGQPVYAETGSGVLCFCGTDHYDLVNQQWALAESGGTGGVGGSGVAGVGAPMNDAWTHGIKTLLYMRVNFPDDLTEPISEAAAYSVM